MMPPIGGRKLFLAVVAFGVNGVRVPWRRFKTLDNNARIPVVVIQIGFFSRVRGNFHFWMRFFAHQLLLDLQLHWRQISRDKWPRRQWWWVIIWKYNALGIAQYGPLPSPLFLKSYPRDICTIWLCLRSLCTQTQIFLCLSSMSRQMRSLRL